MNDEFITRGRILVFITIKREAYILRINNYTYLVHYLCKIGTTDVLAEDYS